MQEQLKEQRAASTALLKYRAHTLEVCVFTIRLILVIA
jgi:hypothetical protein